MLEQLGKIVITGRNTHGEDGRKPKSGARDADGFDASKFPSPNTPQARTWRGPRPTPPASGARPPAKAARRARRANR